MPTVTYIDARLSANTTKFDSGMQKAQRELQGFSAAAHAIGGRIGQSMAGMGTKILASVAAFASFRTAIHAFSESADRLDRFAKTADSLGMSAETLQAFERHAGLAGVETDALAKSLRVFEVALGKTQIGTEAMRESAGQVFRDLKLDINELIGLPVAEQFSRVAEALMEIDSTQERLALGAQLFGRNVLEIMPALADARENLKASQDFAERFGLSLSRLDVGRVEQMNDTWSDVWRVLTGVVDKLTVALAPSLTVVAENLLTMAETILQGGKTIDALTGKAGGLDLVAEVAFFITEGFKLMGSAVMQVVAGLHLLQGDLETAWDIQKKINATTTDFWSGESHARFMSRLDEIKSEMAKPRPMSLIDEELEIEKVDSVAKAAEQRFSALSFQSPSSAAVRGSAAAASQIAQINKQTSGLFRELREALAKAIDKSGDMVAGAVGVTNTILGDTNSLLRSIEGGILLEPESEI